MKKNTEQKNTAAIVVKNLSKKFFIPHEKISSIKIAFVNLFKRKTSETFYALKDVSFEVKRGEFFGILGRNGSGKSTLLKILAGVYTADKGSVHINGLISPFLELGIGFNPELSGGDNIYLNATVLGLTEAEIDEKFDSIVAFSELERFIDQKVKNYSSGMNVRLAFSVAIHANREILLMDEVLAVGDSNFQAKCLREFARYKEMGKTVILVTHDIGTVQRYCDRAMLLRNGEVAMIGTAEEVGNEYIYQNMSDEEKRIIKEQERTKAQAERDMVQARAEAEKLKGRALKEERKRLEEEKSRQETEQKRLEEERKSKVVEITSIDFYNKLGEKTKNFRTGEDIEIRINYLATKPVQNPVFGVSIDSDQNIHITGPNTRKSNMLIAEMFGIGHISMFFKNCPLNRGVYYVTCGIFDWNESITYDFKIKINFFQINTIDKTQDGVFKSDIVWSLKNI